MQGQTKLREKQTGLYLKRKSARPSYYVTTFTCAQLEKTWPLPPYVTSSSGNWATSGSRLFKIITIIAAACWLLAGIHDMGYALKKKFKKMRKHSKSVYIQIFRSYSPDSLVRKLDYDFSNSFAQWTNWPHWRLTWQPTGNDPRQRSPRPKFGSRVVEFNT